MALESLTALLFMAPLASTDIIASSVLFHCSRSKSFYKVSSHSHHRSPKLGCYSVHCILLLVPLQFVPKISQVALNKPCGRSYSPYLLSLGNGALYSRKSVIRGLLDQTFCLQSCLCCARQLNYCLHIQLQDFVL